MNGFCSNNCKNEAVRASCFPSLSSIPLSQSFDVKMRSQRQDRKEQESERERRSDKKLTKEIQLSTVNKLN